ncbi:acetyl-CoA carboxylase biotin carboxylase subunit [Bradyrhizobium sp. B097]|uniref:acetyl-CoA carboxylase biotin carboxylase subunit n=1 Tax=Bradyrhizobium sp. B097 TaxID=3140244 RepID=UPI003184395A
MSTFQRIFIANRGEIAVRIIRACRALGIETVIGVSSADRDALGTRLADRAVCIGPASAGSSYLRADTIVTAAKLTACQALHPGYGFLSERASLQRLCAENDIVFIGPSAEAIEAMGDKLSAIALAERAGVPIIPGSRQLETLDAAHAAAQSIGWPCLIKASAGGGGRGMRVVRNQSDLPAAYDSAKVEAKSAFGDGTVYLERFIENAKHIEVQIIADTHGNVCHLFERDCSVQRRHQKLIEEAPAIALSSEMRDAMTAAAVQLARQCNYTNAGTVEFVYDMDKREFFFLEMNSRIQVEHPVTEMVTGIDLVQEQIRVAQGEPLSFRQADVQISGHAIECRINAEDVASGFRPSPGRITRWCPPSGEEIRVETHCTEGYAVPHCYDSMIAKLVVWGSDRSAAIRQASEALRSFDVGGISTTIAFDEAILRAQQFRAGAVTTRWVEALFLPTWISGEASGATK